MAAGRRGRTREHDLGLRACGVNRAPFLLTQALRRRGFGRLLYVASTAAQVGGIITGQTVQVNGGVYFT